MSFSQANFLKALTKRKYYIFPTHAATSPKRLRNHHFSYERVVSRVFENPVKAEREDAAKILGWITCSKRPLKWREVQAIFCIDPESETVDFEDRQLLVTCKELCGSLVDLRSSGTQVSGLEDLVEFVHETARG